MNNSLHYCSFCWIYFWQLKCAFVNFFFLVFSAIEFGLGLVLLLFQNIITRSINLNDYDNNFLKFSNRFKNKLYYDGQFSNFGSQHSLQHGEGTSFYENEAIEYIGSFKNGQKHGHGMLFDEAGNLISRGEFKYGEIPII